MINTVTQSAVYFCNAFKSRLNVLFTVHVTNNHKKFICENRKIMFMNVCMHKWVRLAQE